MNDIHFCKIICRSNLQLLDLIFLSFQLLPLGKLNSIKLIHYSFHKYLLSIHCIIYSFWFWECSRKEDKQEIYTYGNYILREKPVK